MLQKSLSGGRPLGQNAYIIPSIKCTFDGIVDKRK